MLTKVEYFSGSYGICICCNALMTGITHKATDDGHALTRVFYHEQVLAAERYLASLKGKGL